MRSPNPNAWSGAFFSSFYQPTQSASFGALSATKTPSTTVPSRHNMRCTYWENGAQISTSHVRIPLTKLVWLLGKETKRGSARQRHSGLPSPCATKSPQVAWDAHYSVELHALEPLTSIKACAPESQTFLHCLNSYTEHISVYR